MSYSFLKIKIWNILEHHKFKNLRNTILYLAGSMTTAGTAFVLLPVFTKYLTTYDYGVLSFLYSLSSICGILISLKPSLMIIPQLSSWDELKLKKVLSGFIFSSIILSIVIGFIAINFIPTIFPDINWEMVLFVVIISAIQSPIEIKEALLQVNEKAFRYLKLQLLKSVIPLFIALYFITVIGLGWKGKYLPEMGISLLLGISIITQFWKEGRIHIKYLSLNSIKDIWSYSTPLLFHSLGIVLMLNIDRIIIIQLLNIEANGIYSIGYTIGAFIGIIHDSFLKVWSPIFYKGMQVNEKSFRIRFRKFKIIYIFIAFSLLGAFTLCSEWIFNLLVDQKFYEALGVVPYIALGITFEGIRKLFVGHLYFQRKVKLIATTTFIAGITNIILNYLLIPKFGIYGAAYSTLLAYFMTLILTVLVVSYSYRISPKQNFE